MSGFGDTALLCSDPFADPRIEIHTPFMSLVQKRQFAKAALEHIPGGKDAFNRVFGGPYVRQPGGLIPIPDTGVPWTLGSW